MVEHKCGTTLGSDWAVTWEQGPFLVLFWCAAVLGLLINAVTPEEGRGSLASKGWLLAAALNKKTALHFEGGEKEN